MPNDYSSSPICKGKDVSEVSGSRDLSSSEMEYLGSQVESQIAV